MSRLVLSVGSASASPPPRSSRSATSSRPSTARCATFSPANFFSFFTIQTNLFAIAMLGLVVIVRPPERSVLFDAVRGAVTLYITITGVVFALLLAGLQESLDTHIAWVDFTVHKLMPVVLVADWLIDPPRHRLSFRIGLGLVALSPRVPGLHPDPRRSGRLVPVPVPRRLAARLRRSGSQLRGDARRVRRCRLRRSWRPGTGGPPAQVLQPASGLRAGAHLDRVPELAALAPELLDAAAFLDEAELAIERDRGGVVGEDGEAELVAPRSRAEAIPVSKSAVPTPRPRHSRATASAMSQ